MGSVVLDTNIVLDLWVYEDPATPVLLDALQQHHVRWLSTSVMRDELERVLTYPHIVTRMARRAQTASEVLSHFDAHAQLQSLAPKAPYTCKDGDDQKFIDLAVTHGATLVSKDKAVLTMRNRLARVGVSVVKAWQPRECSA
jgi:putative PIN family toxin of toxin-antitoxin system